MTTKEVAKKVVELVHPSSSERGGMTRRGFCPECGSPVAVKPDATL